MCGLFYILYYMYMWCYSCGEKSGYIYWIIFHNIIFCPNAVLDDFSVTYYDVVQPKER